MMNVENLLAKKNLLLQDLEDELITTEKKLRHCQYEQEALKEKKHELMLREAGTIVEKAGLLESYDENELYLLLLMNKSQLTKKG